MVLSGDIPDSAPAGLMYCLQSWKKWNPCLFINSSPPNAAYMRQWIGSPLVQIMACRLFGAKPLPESMLDDCQMDSCFSGHFVLGETSQVIRADGPAQSWVSYVYGTGAWMITKWVTTIGAWHPSPSCQLLHRVQIIVEGVPLSQQRNRLPPTTLPFGNEHQWVLEKLR